MKLAMLLGCSGSEKGYVTSHLKQPHQIITVDLIRSDALKPLQAFLIRKEWHRWGVWDALIPNFDVVPALAAAIKERYPTLNCDTAIVAEGGLLAHELFRFAFLGSLHQIDLQIAHKRIYWIDPAPEEVYENRKRRHRERRADRNVSIERVRGEIAHYAPHAKRSGCVRFTNATSAIRTIDEFIAPDDRL